MKKRKSKVKVATKKAPAKTAINLSSVAKAKRSIARLPKKSRDVLKAITERRHRKADVRRGPGALIEKKSPTYLRRKLAKKVGGKSFRPRLYFYKGQLFASPQSDASMGKYTVNPFKGSNMARRRKSKKAYKANPSRRRKHYRRNPSPMGAMTKKENIMSALTLGAGLIAGLKGQKYLHGISMFQSWRKFNGIIPVALGILLAVRGKKDIAKKLGWGLAASGVYDLVSQNVPQLALMPVEGIDMDGTQTYNAPIMGAQVFNAPMMGETMVVGDTTEIVGADVPGGGVYDF